MLASEIATESNLAFHSRIRKMPIIMKQATSEEVLADSTEQGTPAGLEKIETRFGTVEITRKNPLVFEHGLLGVPNSNLYVLADFPSQNLGIFKLLQSLDAPELSFITLPLELENAIIERADLEKAASDIGIAAENMAVLLIVSVHRTPSEVKLSVNARAPILIDVTNRYCMQYVFQHSRYKVQHLLEMAQGNA
jgi:flagellar assembly factor FliW